MRREGLGQRERRFIADLAGDFGDGCIRVQEQSRRTVRAYLFNTSFTANVVDDIPHESRLEPANWGEAEVK